ncbi:Hpt domain-containing protein [Qipengyuania thermophila]|uniref:Hpt domain-containing protein n=1 Tax=Qipengyuania thermophila TaxID=2509361 RepID=UPI001F19DFD6|nr:Hpt domain-containing protein [Qipengyuania thermophila]
MLPRSLDTALATAVGPDPALHRELRDALLESVERQVDLLRQARGDAHWYTVSARIRGLAVSFMDEDLTTVADAALLSAPGEPVVIDELTRWIEQTREEPIPG